MYEPPQDNRPGCRETLILTRAAFGVLFPVLGVMIVVFCLVLGTLYLLLSHPVLAALPLVVLVGGGVLYSRWERRRFRPPDA